MAIRRTDGDINLDFRTKDFSKMSEKGLSDPSEQAHPLNLLELFGGIGAPRHALERLRYNLKSIDYVEVLPFAVLAYNKMFECGPKPQDIRIWNMHPDIVVHGSPCQDWSQEGKNNINTGRSILFERVLQILDPNPKNGFRELSKQPKVVIWENVPRLMWAYQDVLDYYMDVMREFGYESYAKILSADDYNIPQRRERVFVVSILKTEENYDKFKFPEPIPAKWKLMDFVDKTVDFNNPEVQLSDKEKAMLVKTDSGALAIKQATKKGYIEIEEGQAIDFSRPGSTTRRGRVGNTARTITCGCRQGVYYNGNVRMFTSKELMRLMGFTDAHYKKMVEAGLTSSQITALAGNSICVPVLVEIFKELANIGCIPKPEDTYSKKQKSKN